MATKRPLVLSSVTSEPQVLKPGDTLEVDAGGTGVTTLSALKTALGLDSVENKTSATIRGELTSQDVIDALGFTPSAGAGGGITYYTATVDFGNNPTKTRSFNIANASVVTTNKVMVVAKPDSDEYEMDALICSGYCTVNGTVTIIVTAVPGPVRGTRNIIYWLG